MHLWVDEVWSKIEKKMAITSEKIQDNIFPYTINDDGKFVNDYGDDWWTNGFWPGIMWLMYTQTQQKQYMDIAKGLEKKLDKALYDFDGLNHDVGFMWLPSSVVSYRLTKDAESKKRAMIAASILASRFNLSGNFIRAWNGDETGLAIIDCLMNLPLLYWAAEESGDPRFAKIAQSHADMALKTFIRSDGSVNHIVEFEPNSGEVLKAHGGQGYADGSSWSRGQAWAIYGFVLSYVYLGKQEYLDAAKRVSHYFIAALSARDDFVPNCDFRSPEEPVYKDTTAGVIAACGMLELARLVPELEKDLYQKSAERILRETEERYCDWSEKTDAIVHMGTSSYVGLRNKPIIYGDYFFIEAVTMLKGSQFSVWKVEK